MLVPFRNHSFAEKGNKFSKTLGFDSNFIFFGHFLELISLEEGQGFLDGCHRILKDNGVIRITASDLTKIIDLYQDKNKFVGRKEYAGKIFGDPDLAPCILFQNLLRLWGHKFIYDKGLIESILTR